MAPSADEPQSEITPTLDIETDEIRSDGMRGDGGREGTGAADGTLARGATVARYVILELAGRGGMGQVYAAYDPDLDRKVALKLLRAGGGDAASRSRLEARLLKEAKALARLAHANVVTVFDVGAVDVEGGGQRIYLAMEYVAGSDLAHWLAAEPRSHGQILDVFLAAGRGLEAAHEAGIVHRDFKPGNVLVGEDGRVLVCDFGLARSADRALADLSQDAVSLEELAGAGADELARLAGADGLSRSGAALGTPGYRAPEQLGGEDVGPAADQYSFCVALYRALYGRRPDEPADAAEKSPLEPILRRGLDPRPEARHASMAALLDALEPKPRSRGWIVAALLAATLLAGGLGLFFGQGEAAACSGGERRMAEIWNARASHELAAALGEDGALAPMLGRAFDDYAGRWVERFVEVCRASRRGEQSEELLDRRMACLEVRRQELRWMIAELTGGVPMESAVAASASLPDLEPCDDHAALLAPVAPPDEQTAGAVATVRRDLAAVRAQRLAGDYARALVNASAAVEASEAIAYWPLVAEALFERGRTEEFRDQAAAAAATYRESLLAAEAGRHDRLAVDAFLRLVRLAGYETLELDEARRYGEMARALLATLGERRRLQATLEDHLGLVRYQAGDYEAAENHHRRALMTLGPIDASSPRGERLLEASSQIRLGNVERALGRLDEADAAYGRGFESYRALFGDEHPELAVVLDRRGGVALERGELERAGDFRRRAVEILRRTFGDEHPRTLEYMNNLGAVLLKSRDFEGALEIFTRLRAAHPGEAEVAGNLGSALLGLSRGEEALAAFGEALALQRESYGEAHPLTALARYNLAEALNELDRPEEALEHHRRALAQWRARLGDRHFLIAHGTTGIGRSLLELGRPRQAVESLRQAAELWAELDRDPAYAGENAWLLARALGGLGRGEEAVRQAEAALDLLGDGPLADEVASWLLEKRADEEE